MQGAQERMQTRWTGRRLGAWARRAMGMGAIAALALACAGAPPAGPEAGEVATASESSGADHREGVASKEELIREYLELSGASEMGAQMSNSLMAQLRPVFPNVPDAVWSQMLDVLEEREPELLAITVTAMDHHFSTEEIRALVDFYSSPVGRDIAEKMPMAMQESLAAGRIWGQQMARELLDRLAAQGYEPVEL